MQKEMRLRNNEGPRQRTGLSLATRVWLTAGVRAVGMLMVVVLMAGAGCSSTYRSGYDYAPRPVDQEVGPSARLVMTVLGIRKAEKQVRPESVEVLIRIENGGERPIRLGPGGLSMTAANLVALKPVETQPEAGAVVSPGDTAELRAYFLLPDGGGTQLADLDGLSLRVTATVGDESVTRTATFTRQDNVRGRRSNVGFGVGIGVGL